MLPRFILGLRKRYYDLEPVYKRSCNLCGFHGHFGHFGQPVRLDAECPQCHSLERHRLIWSVFEEQIKYDFSDLSSVKFLHFAPEPMLEKKLRRLFRSYISTCLSGSADKAYDIENITCDANIYDIVLANHVLEHIDDHKAASEIARILKPNGKFICTVPVIEGWDETYQDDTIKTPDQRYLHFGQHDHLRFYGNDFSERFKDSGLALLETITANPNDVIRFGLQRGEKVFVFKKEC